MRRGLIIVGLLAGVLAWTSPADADNRVERQQDKREIRQDQATAEAIETRLKELEHVVDLWHDANLKDDDNKIRQYESQMRTLIQNDMRETSQQINRQEREVVRSADEYHRDGHRWSERADDRRDRNDDRSDVAALRSVLGGKKRVAAGFSRAVAFSNKYRLVNDYMNLMRQQMGQTQVELVEDTKELQEDSRRLR